MARLFVQLRDRFRHLLPGWFSGPLAIIVIVGASAGGWYTMFGDQGLVTLRALRRQLLAAQREEGQLREQIHQLTTEQARLKDPAYLEQVIRRELGYVKPNERVYQFAATATPPQALSVPSGIPALAVTPAAPATPAKTDKKPVKTKTSKKKTSKAPAKAPRKQSSTR